METRLTLGLVALIATTVIGVPAAAASVTFDQVVAQTKAEMLVDPAAAAERATEIDALAARDPSHKGRDAMRATALWLRGEAYNRLGRTQDALPMLADARRLAIRSDPRSLLVADILLSQGSALTDAARITEALSTLQEAHSLFLHLRQGRSRAKALILIAMLYDAGRDYENALRYFRQAQEAYAADPGLMISIYNGRGTAFFGLGHWHDAEAAFASALEAAHRMGASAIAAQCWGNIASVRLKEGRLPDAAAAIARGMAITRDPAAAVVRLHLLPLAAEVRLRRGDRDGASHLVDTRFKGVDLDRTIIVDREAHETAYRVYLARGDTALALRHLAALKRLDDQATQIARSTSAALAAARFDYTNQELRIAKLKATDLARSVAFERAAARTQWQIFVGAALGTALVIVLLAVALVTIRRSRNVVRAANADLEVTNGKLEKALAAKTEFLATTSHEIRTPLNGILGMTQVMIADRSVDAATRERLALVHGAGTTMRALVDDILDVAKIETGKMTIEARDIDVVATVRDAARMWRDQAVAKGLSFDCRVDLDDPWVTGDAARLRQIVFNLLSNAVKFTAAGGIVLSLERGDGRLRLTVADTGIGIAREAHEVIFESFRQADAGTTRQFGGTGLGLSICRNLARAMGGDVTVESEAGEGALFTLDLPLVPAAPPQTAAVPPALLVIERNPIQRAMFRTLFAALDPVVFADDAEEALRIAGECAPERLLADAAALTDVTTLQRLAEAIAPAPVIVLAAAGEGAAWQGVDRARIIERPIGKKQLVIQVESACQVLVPEAA